MATCSSVPKKWVWRLRILSLLEMRTSSSLNLTCRVGPEGFRSSAPFRTLGDGAILKRLLTTERIGLSQMYVHYTIQHFLTNAASCSGARNKRFLMIGNRVESSCLILQHTILNRAQPAFVFRNSFRLNVGESSFGRGGVRKYKTRMVCGWCLHPPCGH